MTKLNVTTSVAVSVRHEHGHNNPFFIGVGATELNRAHSRFSPKQTKKPSVEDLLPIIDIKNLKDPEEFFMTHEQLENAGREIQKQLPSEPYQDSTKSREYQPGLPGFIRRRVQYKHRFSKETLDNNDDDLSSQEAFEFDSIDCVGDNSDKGETSLTLLYNEKTAIEENIDGILKGLLTWDSEELEGVGAMNLLQKRLHIKPINNLLKEIDIKTPPRWNVGYAKKQLTSPTPPKSPFVLFSTLHKYISRSKPSVDPFSFSAHESDHVSTKKYSPTHMINREVNIVGSSEPSDELGAPRIEDVIAAGETNKFLDTSEKSKEDNSRNLSEQLNASLIEDEVAASETCSIDDPIRNCTCTPQKSMVDNSMEHELNANVDSHEHSVDMDLDIGGSGMGKRVMDDAAGRQNVNRNKPYQFEDKMLAKNMQEITASIPTDDSNFNLVIPLADQSNPDAYEANSMDERSRRLDAGPEQCLQEKSTNSVTPVNGQKRVKICPHKESKGKRLRLRKSLTDAGTSWECGVRRSNRFKTRPLEYWKGERMVYGRVHESLSTVIGVKRLVPGSDGKQTMEVKSFVSDKYKKLFELASRY